MSTSRAKVREMPKVLDTSSGIHKYVWKTWGRCWGIVFYRPDGNLHMLVKNESAKSEQKWANSVNKEEGIIYIIYNKKEFVKMFGCQAMKKWMLSEGWLWQTSIKSISFSQPLKPKVFDNLGIRVRHQLSHKLHLSQSPSEEHQCQ